VNEFGPVGLDAALVDAPVTPGQSAGATIREVAGGCICCNAGFMFDADRTARWLDEPRRLPGTRRIKAVLRTDGGWWGFNLADGIQDTRPSGYRRDSRLEVIVEGASLPDDDALERGLRTPGDQSCRR
jgi:hypothetical protein